jgi:hypothetical protein
VASESTINPYAAPSADLAPPPLDSGPPDGAMFSPLQIGVAALFGSVIAGALVMQANYRAMGEPRAANVTVGVAVAAAIGLYVAGFNIESETTRLVIGLVAIVSFWILASRTQRDLYDDHVLGGGRRGSSWWVVGAIVASLALRVLATSAIRFVIHMDIHHGHHHKLA